MSSELFLAVSLTWRVKTAIFGNKVGYIESQTSI